MHTFRDIATTDANGDATIDVNMKIPFLFSNLRGFFSAGRIEFARVYALIKKGAGIQDVGGNDDGGGGGGGGVVFRSPPNIVAGKLVEANQTLQIVVQAGVPNAAIAVTVLFDWIQVQKS